MLVNVGTFIGEPSGSKFSAYGLSLTAPVLSIESGVGVAIPVLKLIVDTNIPAGYKIQIAASVNADMSSPFETITNAILTADLTDGQIDSDTPGYVTWTAMTSGAKYFRAIILDASDVAASGYSNIPTITLAVGTAPANTVAPAVTGGAWLHGLLTTTDGTWTGTATIVYTYQWTRGGVDIGGATSNTYTLVAADRGTNVLCRVTGTNGIGNSAANSNTIAVAAAGTNLFTKTEIISGGSAWTLVGITVGTNDTTAPDGAVTADDVREDNANSSHEFFNTSGITISNGVPYTLSCFVEPNEDTKLQLNIAITANNRTWFDLTGNGAVLTTGAGVTAVIQKIANGRFRISVTRTSTGTTAFGGFGLAKTDNVATYTGVTGDGAWVWGMQLEQAAAMTSYSAVA